MSSVPKNVHDRPIFLFSLRFSLTVGLSLLLLGIAFWRMGYVTEKDMKEYLQLMSESETSSVKVNPYTARQERLGIQKDMFFQKGNDRLQIRLKAEKAYLVLDHQDTHTHIVERMHHVKCCMQEELYYVLPDGREALQQPNGQLLIRSADDKDQASWVSKNTPGIQLREIIRYIEADEAEYHYKDDRFVANGVKITHFSMPGHQLQDINEQAKILMKGTAMKVEFTLKEKDRDLNFKAEHLKATFFDLEKMNL